MAAIACCDFPTTVLILDDDRDFLKGMQYALSEEHNCICVDEVTKARDILVKDQGWAEILLGEGITRIYQDASPSFSVSMDVLSFKNQVYNPDRFKHIAVAIVDYDMPEKNGLDFIRNLEGHQKIKFIMLTGKAEQSTVIQAFNDKEIHRYVSKGDPNYLQVISEYIKELQAEFFFDFSKFILDSLRKSETNVLENNLFIEIFHKIIHENDIVEYYLLDESGSFFFQDAKAETQVFLIVKSEENMTNFYELAKEDPEAPSYMIQQLKDRKSLTHFSTPKKGLHSAKYWNLIEAQPLDEKREHYYAILKNDDRFQLDRSQIKSYYDFLKKIGHKESELC